MASRYDYSCSKCEYVQEEIHGMLEYPKVICNICGGKSTKMICGDVLFNGVDGSNSMYDFVDQDTTGKPMRFTSKRAWRTHLKSKGLTDDIPQSVPNAKHLKPYREGKSKETKRREYKESVTQALKETGILQKYGK